MYIYIYTWFCIYEYTYVYIYIHSIYTYIQKYQDVMALSVSILDQIQFRNAKGPSKCLWSELSHIRLPGWYVSEIASANGRGGARQIWHLHSMTLGKVPFLGPWLARNPVRWTCHGCHGQHILLLGHSPCGDEVVPTGNYSIQAAACAERFSGLKWQLGPLLPGEVESEGRNQSLVLGSNWWGVVVKLICCCCHLLIPFKRTKRCDYLVSCPRLSPRCVVFCWKIESNPHPWSASRTLLWIWSTHSKLKGW